MQINITQGQIKNSICLSYKYIQTEDNFENKITTQSDSPIHDDLRRAFMTLTPHLVYICELITKKKAQKLIELMDQDWSLDEENEFYNEDLADFFKKYRTESFEISGNGDKEGVKISGFKLLDTMKSISLTTPKETYADYDFGVSLSEAVETCRTEVYEYFKGKQAPNNQTEMDFEFNEENE